MTRAAGHVESPVRPSRCCTGCWAGLPPSTT